MHDERVDDLRQLLDGRVDLTRPQPHAAPVQRRVGAAGDDAAAALGEQIERALRIALWRTFTSARTPTTCALQAIAREVAAFLPDLVLFGGDYVNMQLFGGGRVPPRVIARMLARMMGRHGRFAILGNHDYTYGEQEVAAALRAHGIAVLDHERGTFSFGKHAIDVVGVPDAHMVRPQARALLAGLAPGPPDDRAGPRPGVVRAGAGGAVPDARRPHPRRPDPAPGLGIVKNSSRAPLRWSHGLVVEGGRHLIVTAGLGTSGIPLRIGVPPEFVLIEVTGP